MNLVEHLQSFWPADVDTPAIELADGRTVTYRQLGRRVRQFESALAELRVPEGGIVAVQTDKCVDFLAIYLATIRSGRVFLPLNPTYTTEEVAYYLKDSAADLVICQPGRLEEIEMVAAKGGCRGGGSMGSNGDGSVCALGEAQLVDARPPAGGESDTAVVLYTSGTTGRPKGALLTHANVVAMVDALHESWGWRPDDVLLHALPLFHIHGLFVAATVALRAGATMILQSRFEPSRVLEALPRSSVFMAVPTIYHRLMREDALTGDVCQNVRLFACGSAPLSVSDFEAFEARTGHVILERYGMTETGMLTSNPLRGIRKAGSVGVPLPGVSVRLVDRATFEDVPSGEVGEIWVRGPNVFAGYRGRPDANAEAFVDGWFRTGDLGRQDPDGYYGIVGRARDVVISGGLNVYPSEVEAVIDAISGVDESAVIGLPDDDLGERVAAVVVRASETVTAESVVTEVRRHLAPYKCPRRVEFVSLLPRNAMGKVDKEQLRRAFAP